MGALGGADQYIILLTVVIVFTVLAIFKRSATLYGLCTIGWWAAAGATLLEGSLTSDLTVILPWFYFGIGSVFLVVMFVKVMGHMKDVEKQKWEELP